MVDIYCVCGGTIDVHIDGCGAYVQRGVTDSQRINGRYTRIVENPGGVSAEGGCQVCDGSLSGSMTYMVVYNEAGEAIGSSALCSDCISALRMEKR